MHVLCCPIETCKDTGKFPFSKQHQNCRIFVVVAVTPTPSLSHVNKLIIMHIFQGVSTVFWYLFFGQCLLLLLCFPQCYNVNCSCGAVSLLVTFKWA